MVGIIVFIEVISQGLADGLLDVFHVLVILLLTEECLDGELDTLGHIVGDHVISSVSQKICTVFSENDFVGRIGGDEFAVFMKLPALDKQQWRGIIDKKAAAHCKFIDEVYSDGKSSVRITSSIGISLYPNDGRNFEELYGKADLMLYNSKNSGKNKFSICE